MMLDCLIENIYCKEGLLDFCDHLEKISDAPKMGMVVSQLRAGKKWKQCIPTKSLHHQSQVQ